MDYGCSLVDELTKLMIHSHLLFYYKKVMVMAVTWWQCDKVTSMWQANVTWEILELLFGVSLEAKC